MSNRDQLLRVDTNDLKALDMQLEKKLSELWLREISKTTKPKRQREEWEIDLSRLILNDVIGQGTYGTVFRGSYDGQDVAIKLLDWGLDEFSPEAEIGLRWACFHQEVGVWHKVNHPNITTFIGASMGTSTLRIPEVDSESHYSAPAKSCCLVLEYLAGGTLKNFLFKHRVKKLPFKVVIKLALDLANGLSYLHSKKIVHRDVKSENMLLDGQQNLKIADFGVARVEPTNLTEMTGETGTLGYMAPEILMGKPYDHKCDVYSFAILLWEIYCCDLAYPNANFADILSAVVEQDSRPKIPRCCPKALSRILRTCWDLDPNKRPEMDQVVKMLEDIDTSKGGGMIPDNYTGGCYCLRAVRGP